MFLDPLNFNESTIFWHKNAFISKFKILEPKPYFSLNFWMSKPKPWRTNFRDMQNELPSKEDRKSNLRRVILVIESLNAHSMLGDGSGLKMGGDISGRSGLPVAEGNSKPQYFLKRNLKSGKIAQKFYEKMIEQFASEKKKKNVPGVFF